MSEEVTESPRRAVRKRNKPQKYGDFLDVSPTKRRTVKDSESSEEEFNDDYSELKKPTALFSTDDVEGQDMFKFKSRHTKLDLQNKVKATISSSPKVQTPLKTPRKSFHRGSFASPATKSEATPKHVKDILKKKIIKEIESDSGESDFSGSSSGFVPEEESDNQSESSKSSGSESEEEVKAIKKSVSKMHISRAPSVRARQKDAEYIVAPDDYFMMNSTKKIATSDHTLARLKNMNLNDIADDTNHITEEHQHKINELNQCYETLFNRWLYVLSENFNVILYGVGSKRSVLQKFQAEKLQDFPCVVVNGFFPSLTLKSILEVIVVDLLENSNIPNNIGDVVSLIDGQLCECDMDVFVIIHNIDGLMLRNAKSQAMLASLAQISKLHVIATIDHINAPLLWDHSKLSKFQWSWWDVTTLLPYSSETSFETSLLHQRSGALQLASLCSVFHSLTTNAKGIYKIIIQYQLENHKQAHYQGLSLRELYSKSREQFLVSSDVALRAQLTEFLDHKLVKVKRTYDGGENLVIPIDNSLLQHFLEQQES